MTQTVSLSFYRFSSPIGRAWAMTMMGLARRPLARTPDIGFWKLCGSGKGEGFTPRLIPTVFAILATWPDHETARARVADAPIFRLYQRRAQEHWSVFLTATASRGHWAGESPFDVFEPVNLGPLAVLTRATLKPGVLLRFWSRVPDISQVIGRDPNTRFKIGIGEVPMLHQVTFSIWPSERAMADFARTGPHADAIRAVRREGWFREELYARFNIQSDMGAWNGTSPLKDQEAA